MESMRYFILPTCCIAFNAKVGSSTLACSIVRNFYPEIEAKIFLDHQKFLATFSNIVLPESFTNKPLESFGVWQRICPQTEKPDKIILLPIRDPIERFRSSIAQFEFDVDQALDSLENKTEILSKEVSILLENDVHFYVQSKFIVKGQTKLFVFPDQLRQLTIDAGLVWPLPKINKTKNKKPILTTKQIYRIKQYYDDDVNLYHQIRR
jgi:hypothetical protein